MLSLIHIFLCVLLTTSLMNVVVFPRFDAVFTYARDASVLANATTLIAVGLVATFRPQLLRMRALTAGCLVLLAMGSALLPVGLYTGSAVALTAAACALSIGRGWAIVMVGAAASRLGVRQAGACIALAFVAEYAVTALVWAVSYTHLDVYKRQVDTPAPPKNTMRPGFVSSTQFRNASIPRRASSSMVPPR